MQITFHGKQDDVKERQSLSKYLNHCKKVVETLDYTSLEASLCLPSDTKIISQVKEMVGKKKTDTLRYVIVIGIGGSNLGAKAVYDGLNGNVDMYEPDRYPKMIFLDTNDPEALLAFTLFIEKHIRSEDEFLITIISKSGGTTEIVVNAEIVLAEIKRKFVNWKQRCVIITDENSPLWNEAKKLQIETLAIPKKVGGRYSVLSAVGLFPLGMVGIDVTSLLKGAEDMRQQCLGESDKNPALQTALFLFYHLQFGKTIHNSFFFHSELESLGKWYRQLTGESLGKVGKGITPLVSMGSVDLHSVAQLYLGGPSDKTTEFIYTKESAVQMVPAEALLPSLNAVAGKTTHEIMSAITQGTIAAYLNLKQPIFEAVMDKINAYEIGAYMQHKMMEGMYLAQLLEINAFDQPEVELYKIETKRILVRK